jgi:hypothetical protein
MFHIMYKLEAILGNPMCKLCCDMRLQVTGTLLVALAK